MGGGHPALCLAYQSRYHVVWVVREAKGEKVEEVARMLAHEIHASL